MYNRKAPSIEQVVCAQSTIFATITIIDLVNSSNKQHHDRHYK